MSKEAMKLAKAWFERNTYGDEAVDVYEALCEALAEQPAQQALDKKAENARELGLDYEPAQQEMVDRLLDEAKLLADDRPVEVGHLPKLALDAEHMIRRLVKAFNATQPAQRKPLTDDEIWDAYMRSPICVGDRSIPHLYAFARAIEAAHGIKENT